RGLDANVRENGDNTSAMHWAAAGGHVDVVRRLADAGGDVIGEGDDHELQVIGWAACWPGGDDAAHRAVVELLVERGARHHIFSATALDRADGVRRTAAREPAALNARMSRNENNQTPLQFAVRMQRAEMVQLLIELGADPLAVDAEDEPAMTYATSATVDLPVMRAIHALAVAELRSAERGQRPPSPGRFDIAAALAVGDFATVPRVAFTHPDAPPV